MPVMEVFDGGGGVFAVSASTYLNGHLKRGR